MKSFGNWIDAHGHLADLRWAGKQGQIVEQSMAQGVAFFMQGGVGPEDWQRQELLSAQFPDQIGLCFGLHPYWVIDHEESECEQALDMLASRLPRAMALGELGLDFRPHIAKESHEKQISVFEQQLELAHIAAKPIVMHLVQAHEESLRIMDLWGLPARGGMVHSFNGSWGKAQDFIKRGLMISIGGPVCRTDNQKLHQAVKNVPFEYLLIESDCPDQPPPLFRGQLNPPSSIIEVARTIGEIKSLDPHEILDITRANFERLFKTEK
jgi:TatD DNase family protein